MKNIAPTTRVIITNNITARIFDIPLLLKKIGGSEEFVFILFTYGWATVEEDTETFIPFTASALIVNEYLSPATKPTPPV